MDRFQKEVTDLLARHATPVGFTSDQHPKYKLDTGHVFSTPSPLHTNDPRAWKNSRTQLRRLLGLTEYKDSNLLSAIPAEPPRKKVRKTRTNHHHNVVLRQVDVKDIPHVQTFSEKFIAAARESNEQSMAHLRLQPEEESLHHPQRFYRERQRPQHGEVRTLTQQEIAAANYVLRQFGEAAYRSFLTDRDITKFNITYTQEDPLELVKKAKEKVSELEKKYHAALNLADTHDQHKKAIETELAKPLTEVDFTKLQKLIGMEAYIDTAKQKPTKTNGEDKKRAPRSVVKPENSFTNVRDNIRAIFRDHGPTLNTAQILKHLQHRDKQFDRMSTNRIKADLVGMMNGSTHELRRDGDDWTYIKDMVEAGLINGHHKEKSAAAIAH